MTWIDVKRCNEEYTPEELSEYYYFAYGSNTYLSQMSERCPNSTVYKPATLIGYKLMFRGVADITKRKGNSVMGILYEVTPEDIRELHRFEGYPYKYTINIGDVLVGRKKVKAFWYEIKNKKANLSAVPNGLYFAKIASGYAAFNLDSSDLYNAIRRVQNAVNARNRKKALEFMEKDSMYDQITWLDRYQQLGLIHNNIENK